MASHIKILNEIEKKKFEFPPFLSREERKKVFELNEWELNEISKLRINTNRIGFILLYGYFKATNKYFQPKHFNKSDISYISKKLNIKIGINSFKKFEREAYNRYRQIIVKKLGIKNYSNKTRKLVLNEALLLCSSRKNTKIIFI